MTTKQCKSMQFNRLFRFSKGDIMRINLTVAMLTLCCVQLSAEVFGQRVTMNVRGMPFLEAIRSIEKQSGYTFFYKMKDIDGLGPVTISVKDKPITDVLNELLDDGYSVKIEEKVIVLTKNPATAVAANVRAARPREHLVIQREVRGSVTDSLGAPIAGVSVLIKGTSTGTATDNQGRFQILAVDGQVLEFRTVGYQPQDVAVAGQTVVNIVLKQEETGLEEVVVVAFGEQKKLTTIGAQSTVKAEELKQPVANLTNLIAGRVAGIVGVQRSGEPGYDNAEIYIRGISTFTSSSPLILVDGVERSFNNIDPEDIASFSVLKDASATALYGVRGANGVILIQTKKGEQGKVAINVQYDEGLTEFTRLPQFADGITYME